MTHTPAAAPLSAEEQQHVVEWARETATTRPDGFRTWIAEQVLKFDAALLAARADADALRAEADARFAIYGRLLRGIQRTINGDDVQDHQLRAAIRALIGKMADEFAAMQPWDPDAPKIVQSAALAATPGADARVILTCKHCGFNAGDRAIFETHWQTNTAAATPEGP